MEQRQLIKQMLDFNKTTFNNTFNAVAMLQDQAERMTKMFLEQAAWLPEEGKKILNDWTDGFKKGRDDFKNAMDESFKKVEEFFAKSEKE
ncbi:MAG: hypothetical protein AB1502_16145 [Thermodesulfobacteriota bacterium]